MNLPYSLQSNHRNRITVSLPFFDLFSGKASGTAQPPAAVWPRIVEALTVHDTRFRSEPKAAEGLPKSAWGRWLFWLAMQGSARTRRERQQGTSRRKKYIASGLRLIST